MKKLMSIASRMFRNGFTDALRALSIEALALLEELRATDTMHLKYRHLDLLHQALQDLHTSESVALEHPEGRTNSQSLVFLGMVLAHLL